MENIGGREREGLEEVTFIGDPKEEFIKFLKTFKDVYGKLKYWDKVLDMTIKGEISIVIDFPDIYITNPQLALYVVENPREALNYASQALKELVASENRELAAKIDRFYVRFRGLPETVPIRRLSSEHIEKLIQIEGVVTRMTPTMERLYKAIFQCTNCGTEIEVVQEGDTLEYPTECTCGGKPSFKLLLHKSKFTDVQKIMVQERPEEIPPGQLPRSIEVVLTEDLVDKARPGDRVSIVGILTIKGERSVKKGSKLTFEMMVEANNIEVSQKVLEELEISKEDERKILELARNPKIREEIINSVAPAIYGYEHIKKAIALLLFGGVPKELRDGTRIRGDIHVLLVGDPGTAKSLVYSERILILDENGLISFKPIGEIIDEYMEKYRGSVINYGEYEELLLDKVGVKLYTIAISPVTFKPEIKPIKALIRHKAPGKVIVVKTKHGRKVIVTKDHSLIGFDINSTSLIPIKPAEAFREKTLLPVLKSLAPFRRNVVENVKIGNSNIKLDWDFGYLIGFFLGDGIVSKTSSGERVEIASTNKEVIEYLGEIVRHKLKLPFKICERNGKDRKQYRLIVTDKEFVNWIKHYCFIKIVRESGTKGSLLRYKRIPQITFNAPIVFIRGLVSGLIESNGSIIPLKIKGSKKWKEEIRIVTTNENIAHELPVLLAILGLEYTIRYSSSKYKGKNVCYFKIHIPNPAITKLINLVDPVRQEKLKQLNANRSSITDKDPTASTVKSLALLKLNSRERGYRDFAGEVRGKIHKRYVGRNHAHKILTKLSEIVEKQYDIDEDVGSKTLAMPNRLYSIIDNTIVTWDTIKSIEEVDICEIEPNNAKYVYDISVEDHENFVGGLGLLFLHNSQLLQYVARIAPRGIYTSGKGTTAAGLTAAVLRDKSTGEYYLEAGALVLGDGGIVCLHPETRVLVDNEYVRIADLFDEKKIIRTKAGNETVELNYSEHKVIGMELNSLHAREILSNVIRRKPWKGRLVKLTFESGYELLLTPDHYLVDGETLAWKQASEFKPGDKVLSLQRIPGHEHDVYLLDIIPTTWIVVLENEDKDEVLKLIERTYGSIYNLRKTLGKKVYTSHSKLYIEMGLLREILSKHGKLNNWKNKVLKFSRENKASLLTLTKITPEIGYIIGFIHGNGYFTDKRVAIVQSVRRRDIIERLLRYFETISIKPELYRKTSVSVMRNKKVGSEYVEIVVESMVLAHVAKYFLEDSLRRIFKLPNSVLKGFLAGLIDASGSITVKRTLRDNRQYEVVRVDIVLENEAQAKAIPLVLRRFDIYSKMIRDKGFVRIQITNRDDVLKLIETIKPYSIKAERVSILTRRKAIKLKSHIIPKKLSIKIANKIAEEVSPYILVKDGLWSSVYNAIAGKAMFSKEKLKKIVSLYSEKLSSDTKELISIAAQYDYYMDKVVNVEHVEYEGYVYDIYVPGIHNFLAEGIIVHNCIDEIDKMRAEDRVAIHEAMEQQSYHKDFELLLANGRKVRIGELVDTLIVNNKDKVVNGVETEILPANEIDILSYDFTSKNIVKVKANRVSRHKAPKNFIKITYSNGRTIIVTPEHPVFVWNNGGIITIRADNVKPGMLVPSIRYYPEKLLNNDGLLLRALKEFRTENPEILAKFIGYILSDGYMYPNDKRGYYEIGFSTTNITLMEDFKEILEKLNIKYTVQASSKGRKKTLYTVKVLSKDLYTKISKLIPEIVSPKDGQHTASKRIPSLVFAMGEEAKKAFLNAYFKGDGFVNKYKVGFRTSSREIAEDLQDLLLTLKIHSYILTEKIKGKEYYKVIVYGTESLKRFATVIHDDPRYSKVLELISRSQKKLNYRDPMPHEVAIKLRDILNELNLNDKYITDVVKRKSTIHREKVYKYINLVEERLKTIRKAIESNDLSTVGKFVSLKELSVKTGTPYSTLRYRLYVKKDRQVVRTLMEQATNKLKKIEKIIDEIKGLVYGNIMFIKVKAVEKIENKDSEWVYDVTVEPNQTFVSHGLILHNTISIAKAGIVAKLNARASILAAGNPVLGRYIRERGFLHNINLPPTILSRFDLMFVMVDEPAPERDEEMAEHILMVHKRTEKIKPPIDPELLRKYIGYARKYVKPKLSDEAVKIIKDFFVSLRAKAATSAEVAVPITPRQLEALVRLAEAHARMALSNIVTAEDAKAAIDLMVRSFKDVGIDVETGEIDIDIIMTGKPLSLRKKILKIMNIIERLEGGVPGTPVNLRDVIEEAKKEGISERDVEEIIGTLRREGQIYMPREGKIARLI